MISGPPGQAAIGGQGQILLVSAGLPLCISVDARSSAEQLIITGSESDSCRLPCETQRWLRHMNLSRALAPNLHAPPAENMRFSDSTTNDSTASSVKQPRD